MYEQELNQIKEAETIIFDIGNVLILFDWENYVHSLGFDEETCRHVIDAMFLNEDWNAGDSGLVTTEEWLQLFIDNDPDYEKEIRKTFENFGETIVPFATTRPMIEQLKKQGKKLFFLSNYSDEMYRQSKEKLDFLEEFDGGVFSWKEKCMKPDPQIYKILIDRYRLSPHSCVFFDDREENVEAAKQAGLQGILFHTDIPLQFLEKSCNI